MANEKSVEMRLPSLDELFSSQEERDDAKLKRIYEIPLEEIDPFPDHPFKVLDDEDMMNLAESIKTNGILTPATVRKKEDGRYELLSGHRRLRACQIAGIPTLRCEIVVERRINAMTDNKFIDAFKRMLTMTLALIMVLGSVIPIATQEASAFDGKKGSKYTVTDGGRITYGSGEGGYSNSRKCDLGDDLGSRYSYCVQPAKLSPGTGTVTVSLCLLRMV